MSTFTGTNLSASLTVKDIQQSLTWYTAVIGFEVAQRHEREGALVAVSLRAGEDVRILLTPDNGAKGWDRAKGEGFSLRILTAQNIDELAQGIKDRGGKLENEPVDMPWGARMFRLRDPDGFLLTISS